MDEDEQDQYEVRLKEVFDSFDAIGCGSLGHEELTDLCHMLQLQDAAPLLLQTLLQEDLSGRVHFEQFKEALIFILSTTIEGNFSGEDGYQELDSTEVQPKYVKDGKRYGRKTVPEFQGSLEEVTGTVTSDGRQPEQPPPGDGIEDWKTSTDGDEYEAEGQLGLWNPDELTTPQTVCGADPQCMEERLRAVFQELGVTKDSFLSSNELISICDQCGLQNVDAQLLDDIFQKLDQDGLMRLEDFLHGIFKRPAPSSASTPYRQLKRHHSLQPFDESGRRTACPSTLTSTIGLRLLSWLDDGSGHAAAEMILDVWQSEGIDNGLEILKTLEFAVYGKVNLSELTLALENELLVSKNGIHHAGLATFKNEIRHLMECVDQVLREKEKLRSDLEKAEKLKHLMASEVDDRHATIEHLNECNLRKVEQEHQKRLCALKTDVARESEQLLQRTSLQRLQLEKEMEKVKADEGFLRDRLALAVKENCRLEKELLENSERLFDSERLAKKLQSNLEAVLKEKFGDMDPTGGQFFLQEERLSRLREVYEQQLRELQDRVDELQSQLQADQAPGKRLQQLIQPSLSEELECKSDAEDGDEALGLEECNQLNLSLETEMAIEQLKEQHHQAVLTLRADIAEKVNDHEEQLDEVRVKYETEREGSNQMHQKEIAAMHQEVTQLKSHISDLQGEIEIIKTLQQSAERKHSEEQKELQDRFHVDRAQLEQRWKQEVEEASQSQSTQREELLQRLNATETQLHVQRKELAEGLAKERVEQEEAHSRQLADVTERLQQERDELQRNLLHQRQLELQQGRKRVEDEFNRKIVEMEAQFAKERQSFLVRLAAQTGEVEERLQQAVAGLERQLREEKGQWEFEKEELLQEHEEEMEELGMTLAREKAALARTLAEERESLETTCKDEFDQLAVKHQQLQKETEELKAAVATSAGKESILANEAIALIDRTEDRTPAWPGGAASEGGETAQKSQDVRLEEKLGMTCHRPEISQEGSGITRKGRGSEGCGDDVDAGTGPLDEELPDESEINRRGEMPQVEEEPVPQSPMVHGESGKGSTEVRSEHFELRVPTEELGNEVPDCTSLQEAEEMFEREKAEIMRARLELEQRVELLQGKVTAHTGAEAEWKHREEDLRSEKAGLREKIEELEDRVVDASHLQSTIELLSSEKIGASRRQLELQEKVEELQVRMDLLTKGSEERQKELAEARLRNACLQEDKAVLEEKTLALPTLQATLEMFKNQRVEMEKRCEELEEKLGGKSKTLTDLERGKEECEREVARLKAVTATLEGRTQRLEEEVASASDVHKQSSQLQRENAELRASVAALQEQLSLLPAQTNSESEALADESDAPGTQTTTQTREEEGAYRSQILAMNEAQREFMKQLEILKGDKMSAQKMIEALNKQVSGLALRSEQLDAENEELCYKNSKHQAEVLQLQQGLAQLTRLKERTAGGRWQRWEEEKNHFMHGIEGSQLSRCNELGEEVAALRHINEELVRERESLSDEVNRCVNKIAKMNMVEMQAEHLREDLQASLQEVHRLTAQQSTWQEQVQRLEESLQSFNLQTAKLRSDLRVAEQEKEALRKEVILLHKQLQTSKDKTQTLEDNLHCADLRQRQKLSYGHDLAQLVEQEQRLLREENERLHQEGRHTRGELHLAREKVKQLESAMLTLKHQKHYSKSTVLKAAEQERLCMKREYDQVQKDLATKMSLLSSLEHELQVECAEKESQRAKVIQLESQLLETSEQLLQSKSSLSCSQTHTAGELQQMREQMLSMVPKEQLAQLQEQQHVSAAESSTQQEAYEQLLKKMEERMHDVENKLRNIKLLLQDKVIQLKEQLSKNIKTDEMVKDLYIENAQLFKALEMSEQRQQTTEKKNYLLEENIAGLNKLLKDLTAPSLSATSTCYSS
ncbi:ninein [Amblyraja radiata]|uniref:ninein n=1 Tax=Amblyraja radiata TaxID=386614 RepID=UPI0014020AA7|nr:ninein [Amblyraja radiata]